MIKKKHSVWSAFLCLVLFFQLSFKKRALFPIFYSGITKLSMPPSGYSSINIDV